MSDFYLVSTELREPYPPRICHLIRQLYSELGNELILVEIAPPLPNYVYDTNEDIDWLILAPRYEGDSLFTILKTPIPIYICRLKGGNRPLTKTVSSKDLIIIDWGEIKFVNGSSH